MGKKLGYLVVFIFLFTNCTYFQVREAYKNAEKGNYVNSLYTLSEVLQSEPDNRRTLDAFEIIYPQGEKEYYDQLDRTRGRDIEGYTKALLNLLRVQEIYFSLPMESKNSIAVIEPPENERIGIKRESADSFYKIGNGFQATKYEDKLRKYGFYSEAKKYDVDSRKDIAKKYNESMKAAEGRFKLTVNNLSGRKSFTDRFRNIVTSSINDYPLFSINSKNPNLSLDIKIDNFGYYPPRVQVFSGVDSYFETRVRRVMKRVVTSEVIDGKVVERVKYIPVDEEYEVEIFYKYKRFVKSTYAEYTLNYSLKDLRDNREIFGDFQDIRFEDEVSWVRYYPITHIHGGFYRFPISESEKYVMGEEELIKNVLYRGTNKINEVLNSLDSNRVIDW